MLRTHESKDFLGGVIASLSIPWGFNKGDEDLGGYHLVWPRDLVETAFGFLAAGAQSDAVRVLRYLESTQEADGHWAQNMWLDGRPYWNGLQMDEAAFPILLVDCLRRECPAVLGDLKRWWTMVRRAAGFLVRNGPVTQQDRWEEDAGYSPFTLAVEISGLLAAADFADAVGEKAIADYLRDTADTWNDNVERWTYATEHGPGAAGRSGRLLRAHCAAGDGLRALSRRRICAHQESAARAERGARDSADQPGCAGAGALRPARAGRSAHPEHHQSDRRAAAGETAARPLLVSLQRRRLRRARRRIAVRRHRNRPTLAAAGGRASALRNCCGTPASRRRALASDGVLHRGWTPDSRAGLGRRRHTRARIVYRQTDRLGVSAGVGALRVHQAAALAARRKSFRSAAADRAALPGGEEEVDVLCAGASTTNAGPCREARSCGWC